MQALPIPCPPPHSMQSDLIFVKNSPSAASFPYASAERSRDIELLEPLHYLSDFKNTATGSIADEHGCIHLRSTSSNNKPTLKRYDSKVHTLTSLRLKSMDVSKKDEIVTVTVTELPATDSRAALKSKKSRASATDSNGRKFKVTKPNSRPSLSRTTSGSATTSTSNDSCDSSQEAIVVEEVGVISPPFVPSPGLPVNTNPSADYFATQPNKFQPSIVNSDINPSDSNVCALLRGGIATCDVALTESCLSYLRKRAIYHPLIAIKACAPFACPHPSFPSSIIPYIRPILQEAIRTLLDDFPEYDSGEASTRWSAYLDSVPPVLQELFSHEWCRYVRRIKSFHENSPFDDFDYDHSDDCLGGRHACEARTREVVRDAWNSFWKESILTGNRCVPRPSEVAKFFCTYGDNDSEQEMTTAPNSRCRAGFKEELIQTLECIGGVSSKWCWRWLTVPLDSLFGPLDQ